MLKLGTAKPYCAHCQMYHQLMKQNKPTPNAIEYDPHKLQTVSGKSARYHTGFTEISHYSHSRWYQTAKTNYELRLQLNFDYAILNPCYDPPNYECTQLYNPLSNPAPPGKYAGPHHGRAHKARAEHASNGSNLYLS